MVTKKRAVIKEWLFVRRMRRIVKRYERENADHLSSISLPEEWVKCCEEYRRKYPK